MLEELNKLLIEKQINIYNKNGVCIRKTYEFGSRFGFTSGTKQFRIIRIERNYNLEIDGEEFSKLNKYDMFNIILQNLQYKN